MKLAFLVDDLRHDEHGDLLSNILQVDWSGQHFKFQ